MRISLKPFAGAISLQIPLTQFQYAAFVGKLFSLGEVPLALPEEQILEVFVSIPENDFNSGLGYLAVNLPEICRLVRGWLVQPICMN